MDYLKVVTAGTFGTLVFIILLMVCPLILLSSVNTLAEEANISFYIPHTVYTYLASYGVMLCLRGGK